MPLFFGVIMIICGIMGMCHWQEAAEDGRAVEQFFWSVVCFSSGVLLCKFGS